MTDISNLIIYKSRKILVAHKPAGISSQVNRSSDKSLQQLLEIYLKHRIFIISRLDQPVEGLVLFAMDKSSAAVLSELTRENKIRKKYLALIEKPLPQKEGSLTHYLSRNAKNRKSLVSNVPAKGFKEANLDYTCLHQFDNYQLIELSLTTGRFHQIRAQLGHLGSPIKGDVKYGARRSNKDRSIHLLSHQLSFINPFSNEERTFESIIPEKDGLWKDVKNLLTEKSS